MNVPHAPLPHLRGDMCKTGFELTLDLEDSKGIECIIDKDTLKLSTIQVQKQNNFEQVT